MQFDLKPNTEKIMTTFWKRNLKNLTGGILSPFCQFCEKEIIFLKNCDASFLDFTVIYHYAKTQKKLMS